MKKLQNDFTTPEQSKWLLELGVPADSADCYYLRERPNRLCILNDSITISKLRLRPYMSHAMPCWSGTRLMEIYDICRCYDGDWDEVHGKETYIETYVSAIKEAVLDDMMDFSKLEE